MRAKGVDFLVAPYEANAQLVFMSRNECVDAVMSEDNDKLVVYR